MFDLGLPALVFLGLCFWLVRKVVKAARTESDLEAERLAASLNLPPLPPPPPPESPPPPQPLAADHRALVERLVEEREQQIRAHHVGSSDVTRRVELLWVHSTPTFAVWCERRHAATHAARSMTRDVICVAQISGGAVLERWSFG